MVYEEMMSKENIICVFFYCLYPSFFFCVEVKMSVFMLVFYIRVCVYHYDDFNSEALLFRG